jgi:hypothetical protein
MTAEHLAAIATVQADDRSRRDRPPDRDRWRSLAHGFLWRSTEAGESEIDSRYEGADIARLDPISPDEPGDDLRREAAVRGRTIIGHLVNLLVLSASSMATESDGCQPLCQKAGGRVANGFPFEDSP